MLINMISKPDKKKLDQSCVKHSTLWSKVTVKLLPSINYAVRVNLRRSISPRLIIFLVMTSEWHAVKGKYEAESLSYQLFHPLT